MNWCLLLLKFFFYFFFRKVGKTWSFFERYVRIKKINVELWKLLEEIKHSKEPDCRINNIIWVKSCNSKLNSLSIDENEIDFLHYTWGVIRYARMLQKIGVYEEYSKYQIMSLFILLQFIYAHLERMLQRLDLLFSAPV